MCFYGSGRDIAPDRERRTSGVGALLWPLFILGVAAAVYVGVRLCS